MSFENRHSINKIRSEEAGKDVHILIKFQRHGLRDGAALTQDGREITRDLAGQSGLHVAEERDAEDTFDAAKAIGSMVGTPPATPENPHPMGRALETAHITATTVAGERAGEWKSRPEKRLSYESIKSPAPYDHLKVYNEALAQAIRGLGRGDVEQKDLTTEEKIQVSEEAQAVVIDHVSALDTPEAQIYKKENAGMFADLLEHYAKMTSNLKDGSKVLYAAGTHGGTMEWLLKESLVWTDGEGKKRAGLSDFGQIGGGFNSSDSYNVEISTDSEKQLKELRITFDNLNRPQGHMYLDLQKIHELAEFYRVLHKDA